MTAFVHTLFILLAVTTISAHAAISSADSRADISAFEKNSDPSVYSLVTLPSLNKKRVQSTLEKIRIHRPETELTEYIEESVVYRLVVQCFGSFPTAKKKRSELLRNSRTAFIIKSDNSYCVAASSHVKHENAVIEQKHLDERGIHSTIVKLNLLLPHWQVKIGDNLILRDAVYAANSMSLKGFTTTIIPAESGSVTASQKTLDRLISEEIPQNTK